MRDLPGPFPDPAGGRSGVPPAGRVTPLAVAAGTDDAIPPGAAHRPGARSAARGERISTFGWDMVYAIPFGTVNEAIAAAGSSPGRFHHADDAGAAEISGSFGPWRVTGGSGRMVQMTLPVPAMTLRRVSDAGRVTQVERRDLRVTITILLHAQPRPDLTPRPDGATVFELRARVPDMSGPCGASVVTVDDVSYAARRTGPHRQPAAGEEPDRAEEIRIHFADWINSGHVLAHFAHVFGAMPLAAPGQARPDALQPVHLSYAVTSGREPGEGVFALLCMFARADGCVSIPALHAVDAALRPPPAGVAMAMSRSCFLSRMLLPALARDWVGPAARAPDDDPHWPGAYFEYLPGGTGMCNTRAITLASRGPDAVGQGTAIPCAPRELHLSSHDNGVDIAIGGRALRFTLAWDDRDPGGGLRTPAAAEGGLPPGFLPRLDALTDGSRAPMAPSASGEGAGMRPVLSGSMRPGEGAVPLTSLGRAVERALAQVSWTGSVPLKPERATFRGAFHLVAGARP